MRIQAEDRERLWQNRAVKAEQELEESRHKLETLMKDFANYASTVGNPGTPIPFPDVVPQVPQVEDTGGGRIAMKPNIRIRQMEAVAHSRMEAAKRRQQLAEALEQ